MRSRAIVLAIVLSMLATAVGAEPERGASDETSLDRPETHWNRGGVSSQTYAAVERQQRLEAGEYALTGRAIGLNQQQRSGEIMIAMREQQHRYLARVNDANAKRIEADSAAWAETARPNAWIRTANNAMTVVRNGVGAYNSIQYAAHLWDDHGHGRTCGSDCQLPRVTIVGSPPIKTWPNLNVRGTQPPRP